MNRGMLKMNCNYCKSTKLEYLLNNYNEVKTYLKNTIPNYISKTEDIKNILENLK